MILPAGVLASDAGYIYPGTGVTPLSALQNMHPGVKNNIEILTFIEECGLESWTGGGGGRPYAFVYLMPEKNCLKKVVFRENTSDRPRTITGVWTIGINDTFIETPPDPLEKLYEKYPFVKDSPDLLEFIKLNTPDHWMECVTSNPQEQVFIISDNTSFRELIIFIGNGSVRNTRLMDESQFDIDKKEAFKHAGINSSTPADDIYVRLRNNEPEWVLTWHEGSAIRMAIIPANEIKSDHRETITELQDVPGFTIFIAALSIVFLIISHRKMR